VEQFPISSTEMPESVLIRGKEVDRLDFGSVQFFLIISALLLPITLFAPYSLYAGRALPTRF